MELKFYSGRLMKLLSGAFILLLIASTAGQIYRFTFNNGVSRYITDFFYFDNEDNLPTYFETLLFLLGFLLLTIIAHLTRRNKFEFSAHWFFLGLIFFYLAADELLQLHEQTITPLRNMLQTGDYFYYAWTIPASGFCVLLGLLYIRFLLKIKTRFRILFAASGFIFVSGAIITEIFESHYQFVNSKETFGYSMLTTLEESLEMTGLLLFIYSLLEYIKSNFPRFSISFD